MPVACVLIAPRYTVVTSVSQTRASIPVGTIMLSVIVYSFVMAAVNLILIVRIGAYDWS